MQSETGHIHIGHRPGRVEPRQNIAQLSDVFRIHTTRVVIFMKAFHSLVAYRPNHPEP
jgi:hypothetical protein